MEQLLRVPPRRTSTATGSCRTVARSTSRQPSAHASEKSNRSNISRRSCSSSRAISALRSSSSVMTTIVGDHRPPRRRCSQIPAHARTTNTTAAQHNALMNTEHSDHPGTTGPPRITVR
jgi:hypothetical protein